MNLHLLKMVAWSPLDSTQVDILFDHISPLYLRQSGTRCLNQTDTLYLNKKFAGVPLQSREYGVLRSLGERTP